VQARTDGAKFKHEVVVEPSLCGACGICAGSCPSSNPFRTPKAELKTGIDMPQFTAHEMRSQTKQALESLSGEIKILIFGCEHGLNTSRLDSEYSKGISLICSGMLPPTLVEYALKQGADGVMVTGCRENDCYYRFGNRWTRMRFDGARKPALRGRADRQRIRVHGGAETDKNEIAADLEEFHQHLLKLKQTEKTGATD
ncbi:MAG: hydrogenase iron-sulfur subunit, partial [Aestuariibacter sp.]|nr:hydrogenase iron-sulfur subunit [Aestuariibacter sp.]